MKSDTLPVSVDLMPREAREPSAGPIFTPKLLIAVALSTIPYRWTARLFSEESVPVLAVLEALKRGGYKIVPMERADYEQH